MWKEVHCKGQVLEDALLTRGHSRGCVPLQEGLLCRRGRYLHEEETWFKDIQVDGYIVGQEVWMNPLDLFIYIYDFIFIYIPLI